MHAEHALVQRVVLGARALAEQRVDDRRVQLLGQPQNGGAPGVAVDHLDALALKALDNFVAASRNSLSRHRPLLNPQFRGSKPPF